MSVRITALLVSVSFLCSPAHGQAQVVKPPVQVKPPAKPPAKPQVKPPAKPPVAAPETKKGATPTPAAKPTPAAPSGLRFKSSYTTGDQVTESTTYIQANRERYEFADTILLKRHDQKRTIQISRVSNTYLVTPAEQTVAPASIGSAGTAPKAPGVVVLTTTIVDTGERKDLFGRQARHVTSAVERQPQPSACDQSKVRIEIDGWYIDLPTVVVMPPAKDEPSSAGLGCSDEVQTTKSGDAALLGFPLSYTTTFIELGDKDSKPANVVMEVTEFEVASLDATLFEIPKGMTEAMNPGEFSVAVSNANESRLASGAPASLVGEKKHGAIRVGVPEVTYKGNQTVDTRALRTRLIVELEKEKIEAIPMAATSPEDLQARAIELGIDYLLMAEVTELKASKPGGLTRIVKTTSGEDGQKDITEAKMSVQLVPPGGKPRLSTNTSGKDGGIGLKTGLGLAKFAGSMYLKMMTGGMYGSPLGGFNAMRQMNLGGLGMLGNPALMQMQSGMGLTGKGLGGDRTAIAASFILQQAMMGGASAASRPGPSFDSALDDAIEDAGKKVVESLKKLLPAKK